MKPIIAIPAIALLLYRAYSHKSLTPLGLFVAGATAVAHALHPWNLPFVLLGVFFLAGTRATKVKADVKAGLTLHSKGASGGEGPRTHIQVLSNSLVATTLTLLHAYQLRQRKNLVLSGRLPEGSFCYTWGGDVLVVGIIANYAAVCADTFSSELGILSRSSPRLITSWNLRKVPPGTNGGVTLVGLAAGLLGSIIIVGASLMFVPFCSERTWGKLVGDAGEWSMSEKATFGWFLALWGALGSVLDSFLGGLFQRSVRDVRSGKIVEGEGGVRVLVSADGAPAPDVTKKTAPVKAAVVGGEGKAAVEKSEKPEDTSAIDDSAPAPARYDPADKHRKSSFGDQRPTRVIESGYDLLDNNDVNFLMAFTMSMGAMGIAAWYWGIPFSAIGKP